MRAKAIAVFLTVVVALIGVSLYQVDRVLYSDQISSNEANSRSQMAALVPAFQAEFRSISDHFRSIEEAAFAKGSDFTDSLSNRFEMIAKLTPTDDSWTVGAKAFHDKTSVKSWAENYTTIALKAVKPKDLPLGGIALTALLDPQRKPFFLWILRDEKDHWSAAITPAGVFQAIIDRQRGQTSNVFLVNKQGQILGHTTAEYLGTILNDDPVVKEITTQNKKSGAGLFKEGSKDLQGLYEQIPGSNVTAVLTKPLSGLANQRDDMRMQLLLMGGGLALFGLAALLLFVREQPAARAMMGAGPMLTPASFPAPAPVMAQNNGQNNNFQNTEQKLDQKAELVRERMKAYTTSASAFAREMQGPLTRILSEAQVLKAKSAHSLEASRIEELAREGRNVVQKLLSFSGEQDFVAEPTSLNEVLQRSLALFDIKFQQKGIQVEKNLKRMPEVLAHPLALMRVFEVVLNNAIEAMERMPKKLLSISLEAENSFVVLRFKDSGEGQTPDKVARVFDPFFTTKSPSVHSGLGLATAYGLVREFGGEVIFESAQGQGSVLTVKFPIGVEMQEDIDEKTPAPIRNPIKPPPTASVSPAATASPLTAANAVSPASTLVPPPLPAMDDFLGDDPGASPSAPEGLMDLSPIQSKAIQQTISAIDEIDAASPKKAAPNPRIDPPPARSKAQSADGKLDKPQFNVKKSGSKFSDASVQIRKPGSLGDRK